MVAVYSFADLRRGIEHPKLVLRELNELYHTRLGLRRYNPQGVDVLEEEWDTLIILDACRYDVMEEASYLPGELESRISRGSCSAGFLKGSFQDRELHDTVYVNANPFLQKIDLGVEFHAVVNLWKDEGWSDSEGTVLPGTMTEYAKQVADDYPDKRLVVHYMQPHYPFLNVDDQQDEILTAKVDETAPWRKLFLRKESLPRDRVRELYRENLEHVLPHVEELMEYLDGRTVVTSDHGNMLGERSFPIPIREWGHPGGQYIEPLVKVPWHVHEDGRRKIVPEPPEEEDTIDEADVKERLEALGYATE